MRGAHGSGNDCSEQLKLTLISERLRTAQKTSLYTGGKIVKIQTKYVGNAYLGSWIWRITDGSQLVQVGHGATQIDAITHAQNHLDRIDPTHQETTWTTNQ